MSGDLLTDERLTDLRGLVDAAEENWLQISGLDGADQWAEVDGDRLIDIARFLFLHIDALTAERGGLIKQLFTERDAHLHERDALRESLSRWVGNKS